MFAISAEKVDSFILLALHKFAISVEKADSFILLALHSMFAISVEKADSFILLALLKGTTLKQGCICFWML